MSSSGSAHSLQAAPATLASPALGDAALVARVQLGDLDAFETLVRA